jgi:hypothetical protein
MTRAYNTATTQQNSGGAVPAFIAGKNAIINGDFAINQRGFSSVTTGQYTFDRWNFVPNDGTVTCSVQQFTPGTAPVTGYEAKQYARIVTASQTAAGAYSIFEQRIENVRTFANQTMTMSFWAKAASGTPKVALEITQNFGSGGSPSSVVRTYAGQVTISTSWARYSITVAIPTISGKTVGTTDNTSSLVLSLWTSAGTDFNARTGSIGIQNNTIEFWGVQAEAGSVATPFDTATGTIQGELAACQRYYYRIKVPAYQEFGAAFCGSTTAALVLVPYPVTMRTEPSALEQNGTAANYQVLYSSGGALARTDCNGVPAHQGATVINARVNFPVASGLTAASGAFGCSSNNANAYLGWSAEL